MERLWERLAEQEMKRIAKDLEMYLKGIHVRTLITSESVSYANFALEFPIPHHQERGTRE